MKMQLIESLNDKYYYEKLDNGLEVYLFPYSKTKKFHTSIIIPHGGMVTEIKDLKTKELITFPQGVAHFLEHQMFERNKENLLDIFPKMGLKTNAYTSQKITRYHVSGTSNFNKSLNLLIDFILNPHFSDQGTAKEKNIIIEEIRRSKNRPLYDVQREHSNSFFVNHPLKNTIIGEEEDVLKITTNDLINFHKYLYQPDQLIIAISGNINVNKTMDLIKSHPQIKNNLASRKFALKEYIEPMEVPTPYKRVEFPINVPITFISYKQPITKFLDLNIPHYLLMSYLNIILDFNFGDESDLNQYLIDNRLIDKDLSFYAGGTDKFIYIYINYPTNNQEVIGLIKDKLNNLTVTNKQMEIASKKIKSRNILKSEDKQYYVERIAYLASNYGKFSHDHFSLYNELSTPLANEIIKRLDYSVELVFLAEPKVS
ncbi:MAG: insulinase family protein [Mollicutes bacterium]|nr:insulinase family protein [Mollicutes bacterium]